MFHTRLKVICPPDFSEIMMAEVAEAGFESFIETDEGFEAYVEGEKFDYRYLTEIKEKYKHVSPLLFFQDQIKKQNWNEEWERNVDPIIVNDQCLVRAEFHKIEKKYPYEIIITPKMSFGTGHHQTTYLMLKNMMRINHRNKKVMDAGCGTAILSIMASLLGATHIEAFDIDEWSVLNGQENTEINQCHNITIRQGKISDLTFDSSFDIVLANINRNILLDEINRYAGVLHQQGHLLLSGFFLKDIPVLADEAAKYGLYEFFRDEKETWATVAFLKK
ncbi:MAG: 50S ribosomal protein L11 methyltransferase [Bacteroidetes bacterium]|nr:50S ribosomal protein L11 methyltransferase [Bacteroidota bacterium]